MCVDPPVFLGVLMHSVHPPVFLVVLMHLYTHHCSYDSLHVLYSLLQMLSKKPDKGGDDSDDGGFPLTPGTEANYKKIDEQYAKVMNQGRPDLLSVCP